jgi:hypothetical protein
VCESESTESEGGGEDFSWEVVVFAWLGITLFILIMLAIRWIIQSHTGFDIGF